LAAVTPATRELCQMLLTNATGQRHRRIDQIRAIRAKAAGSGGKNSAKRAKRRQPIEICRQTAT
jgi:hypothetical protein